MFPAQGGINGHFEKHSEHSVLVKKKSLLSKETISPDSNSLKVLSEQILSCRERIVFSTNNTRTNEYSIKKRKESRHFPQELTHIRS